MGVLSTLVLGCVPLTACYSPSFRDCSVACSSVADCARGQVCGSDRLCAAPDLAGRCASMLSDGGVDAARPDARPDAPVDAPPPPTDAAFPAKVQLHVRVNGDGKVDVLGVGTCDAADAATHGDCLYLVTAGVPLTLDAIAHTGTTFEKWTSTACAGQGPLCSLTPVLAVTDVNAKFKH